MKERMALDVEELTSELRQRLQELCHRSVMDVQREAEAALQKYVSEHLQDRIRGDSECPTPTTEEYDGGRSELAAALHAGLLGGPQASAPDLALAAPAHIPHSGPAVSSAGDAADDGEPMPASPSRRREILWSPSQTNLLRRLSLSEISSGPPSLRDIVRSMEFETAFGVVIILNCLMLGLQVHDDITRELGPAFRTTVKAFDHIFTVLFTLEMLMQMRVLGWQGYWPPNSAEVRANLFDVAVVIFTGIIFTWLLPLLAKLFNFDSTSASLRTLTALRVVRLGRLVRVFHRAPIFREAWMLIRGLSDSSRTLFWTVVVILMVNYVFAIFGLQVIVEQLTWVRDDMDSRGEDTTLIDAFVNDVWGLDRMMFMLVQLLTLDEFGQILRKSVKFVWWSWLYWYVYVAVAVFVLMNLVTAIIVENAFATTNNDAIHALAEIEEKKEKSLDELRRLFKLMDADGGGTISWEEFRQSFEQAEVRDKWTLLEFRPEDCKELFLLLDDGDGEIALSEFFEGLTKIKGQAQAKDVFRLMKMTQKTFEYLEALATGMGAAPRRISRTSSKKSRLRD